MRDSAVLNGDEFKKGLNLEDPEIHRRPATFRLLPGHCQDESYLES
jgi:hypothetical protein